MTTWGTVLYSLGQFKIVSPVRISLGQIYVGIHQKNLSQINSPGGLFQILHRSIPFGDGCIRVDRIINNPAKQVQPSVNERMLKANIRFFLTGFFWWND